MYLHREGRNAIITGIFLLIGSLVAAVFLSIPLVLKILVILAFSILLVLFLWFFRIPARKPVLNQNLVIAPADGKIVVIEKAFDNEYFNDERIQVSIFMSPLNVHQNTYPVSGEITYTRYHKGKYLVAWHPKSSTLNERCTVVIKAKDGSEILVRQIAGAVARRICTYSKVGDSALQCGEMGFIKFGSRVDVFLPLTAKVKCKVDQATRNKKTIIAEL